MPLYYYCITTREFGALLTTALICLIYALLVVYYLVGLILLLFIQSTITSDTVQLKQWIGLKYGINYYITKCCICFDISSTLSETVCFLLVIFVFWYPKSGLQGRWSLHEV